jgi:hypothetical protein
MTKLVLHLFHADPAALATVPALAERLHQANDPAKPTLEVFVFGPAEGALSASDRPEFNASIDGLVKLGVRVTTCTGLAQKAGAEAAFRARGLAMESAAVAFPRFAAEAASVVTF